MRRLGSCQTIWGVPALSIKGKVGIKVGRIKIGVEIGGIKSVIDQKIFKNKDVYDRILIRIQGIEKMVREIRRDFSQLKKIVTSHSAFIKQLEI